MGLAYTQSAHVRRFGSQLFGGGKNKKIFSYARGKNQMVWVLVLCLGEKIKFWFFRIWAGFRVFSGWGGMLALEVRGPSWVSVDWRFVCLVVRVSLFVCRSRRFWG